MKINSDEILNDYIDNQLDSSTVNELKKNIDGDEELLNKLKALKLIDDTLRSMETMEAPQNFSDKMMTIINKHAKTVKPKINYFFSAIVSIFGIIITGALVAAVLIVEKQNPSMENLKIAESTRKVISENIGFFNSIFANYQIFFAVGVLMVLLLLSSLIIFDSHKNFKNKLRSITR